MDLRELRLGNFVSLNEGHIEFPLTEVRFQRVISGYYEVEPIPLTEEWLVKFGWLWNEECRSFERYPNADARMNLEYRGVSGSYTMFNYVLKSKIADRIFYVHQLQNLYFALTGEELTIKQ